MILETADSTVNKILGSHESMQRDTYDLKLILPKFLFARLVKEWEIPNVMNKDIAQDGQL